MSAIGSQEKYELLMRIAASRLDVINEAEILTCQIRHQTDYFKNLKSKAFSLPVIGSAAGVLGGLILFKMLAGRKHHTHTAPHAPGGILNSSLSRLLLELLIALILPSLKQVGMDLVRGKIRHLFSFGRR